MEGELKTKIWLIYRFKNLVTVIWAVYTEIGDNTKIIRMIGLLQTH